MEMSYKQLDIQVNIWTGVIFSGYPASELSLEEPQIGARKKLNFEHLLYTKYPLGCRCFCHKIYAHFLTSTFSMPV